MNAANDDRILRFRPGRLLRARWLQGGPQLGEPFPDFALHTVPGHQIEKADYVGERPLLLLFSSTTTPMTRRAGLGLRRLYDEYSERVAFVTLYVGEPDQSHSFEQKLAQARDYQYRERVPWTVAVDDLDGRLPRALGVTANAAYIMALDGTVAFRSARLNERRLRKALRMVTGHSPKYQPRHSGSNPLVGAARRMWESLTQDGDQSDADVHPSGISGRLAAAFRALPVPARGAVGVAAGLLPVAVTVAVIRAVARRVKTAELAGTPGPRTEANRRQDEPAQSL